MSVNKFSVGSIGQKVTRLIADATGTIDLTGAPAPVQVLSNDGEKAVISRETAQAVLAARAAEAAAKTAKERVETALKAELGTAVEIVVDGEVIFTFKPQSKTVLDTTRLKDERPEVFAEFSKQTVVRPLLSKPKIVAALFG